MPKVIRTISREEEHQRSIHSFSVTVGTPGNDIVDVAPVIEKRDMSTGELVEVVGDKPQRFSEAEIRAALEKIEELPAYDVLRVGLAKLMHALCDTRR